MCRVSGAASLVAAAAPHGSEIVLVGLSEKSAQFTPLTITREGITVDRLPAPDRFLSSHRTHAPEADSADYYPPDDTQEAFELAAAGRKAS